MSHLLSLWTPNLKPNIASDPWFPKVDVNTEEILVKEEEKIENVLNAIKNREAPPYIGYRNAKEEEEDTTTLHNDDDDDEDDDDAADANGSIHSDNSEESSVESL